MNLKNGYKTMYEVIDGSNRVFKASKTGLFADAEDIVTISEKFKVVYQRGEEIFGVDAEGVETKLDFDKVFVEATENVEEPVTTVEEEVIETPATEPEKTEEPEEDEGENEIPEEGTEEV